MPDSSTFLSPATNDDFMLIRSHKSFERAFDTRPLKATSGRGSGSQKRMQNFVTYDIDAHVDIMDFSSRKVIQRRCSGKGSVDLISETKQ